MFISWRYANLLKNARFRNADLRDLLPGSKYYFHHEYLFVLVARNCSKPLGFSDRCWHSDADLFTETQQKFGLDTNGIRNRRCFLQRSSGSKSHKLMAFCHFVRVDRAWLQNAAHRSIATLKSKSQQISQITCCTFFTRLLVPMEFPTRDKETVRLTAVLRDAQPNHSPKSAAMPFLTSPLLLSLWKRFQTADAS